MMSPMVESLLARDGADLGDFLAGPWWAWTGFLSSLDDRLDGLVDAALERHRVVAGGDHLDALGVDGLREHGRGGRAVAGDVGGLARRLP